ncbi:MAG TPA: hypothetical protein VGS99_09650 [Gammaproteobacteria bacterium]|nr:hypothetical protein [Gammaproteobacteria bacterium]
MRGYLGAIRGRAWGSAGHGIRMILVIVTAATAGCASMGPTGATRFDAARALGLPPADVIIVSRDYEMSGDTLALSRYTVRTRSDLTYTCIPVAQPLSQADPAQQQVCVPKH